MYSPQNNRKLWKPKILDLGYESNRSFKSPLTQEQSYVTDCVPLFCGRQDAVPEPDIRIAANHTYNNLFTL